MSEKKREPQVGDVWRFDGHTLHEEFTLVSPHTPEPGWNVSTYGWYSLPFNERFTLIRSSTPAPLSVEGTRDWSAWLPPHPLPDTGPKVFKVGQVWAFADDYLGNPQRGVARILDEVGMLQELLASKGRNVVLASDPSRCYVSASSRGLKAVLVAEPGRPPTPPETLYGPAPTSKPAVEKPQRIAGCRTLHGGGFYSTDGKCPKCAKGYGTLAPSRETGAGLAAVSLPSPRQPYVCQVSDEDLLPDAQEGWRR